MTCAAPRSRSGGARGALGLLTVIGGPSAASAASVPWFPVVGAGLGAVLGATWWALDEILPPFVAAGGVVAADLALTGMLHLDGWIDSADGLLPHLERERRLDVMSEPQVGAFGVASAVVLLALRVSALGSGERQSFAHRVLLLAALSATSRACMGLAVLLMPYARQSGMASAYGARPATAARPAFSPTLSCALAVLLSATALVRWRPRAAPAVLVGELAAATGVFALARRQLGGYTGDVLGAAGMAAETTGLVVAAAKW